jgi:hypothetical protein
MAEEGGAMIMAFKESGLLTKGSLLFQIDTRRDSDRSGPAGPHGPCRRGLYLRELEREDLWYVWVSPTGPLPPAEAGKFDHARNGPWPYCASVGS